jgi:hypothetical protein
MPDQKPGQCPFLKQPCIRERCALWGTASMSAPGPLVGQRKPQQIQGCVFNILAVLMASPSRVIVLNPPGVHPPLG